MSEQSRRDVIAGAALAGAASLTSSRSKRARGGAFDAQRHEL